MISKKVLHGMRKLSVVIATCFCFLCVSCGTTPTSFQTSNPPTQQVPIPTSNTPIQPVTIPTPTLTILPPREIPSVKAWNQIIQSVCLVEEMDFPSLKTSANIDSIIRSVLAGLGIRIEEPGSVCDAELVVDITGEALARTYLQRDLYTGAEVEGHLVLQTPDGKTQSKLIDFQNESPEAIVFLPGEIIPENPEDYDFNPTLLPIIYDYFNQLWGPRIYVWTLFPDMTINSNYSMEKIKAIGFQDEILAELMYAARNSDPSTRAAAIYALKDIAADSNLVIPFLVETLRVDPDDQVRDWTANRLIEIGMDAVPALKNALTQEADPGVRENIIQLLEGITGEEIN